jgi:HEAT repeat protein
MIIMHKMTDIALKRQGLSTSSMESLIIALASDNGEIRREAREFLIARGEEALPYLISELTSSKEHHRWEAAKALSEIRHAASAEILVAVLNDQSEDVRWVAAEGLISIGVKSLEPLLRELTFRYNSVEFRTGAAHVLRALSGLEIFDAIRPVLNALRKNTLIDHLPVLAYLAWDSLRRSRMQIAAN